MMTIQQATRHLLSQLSLIYENREAGNIAGLVMEHLTGQGKVDRIINKSSIMPPSKEKILEEYIDDLMQHKPVQYVLNEAWFAGMKLYVDEHVLIPRPETEELVNWVVEDHNGKSRKKIMDIGTGSGCIPIAIKKKLPWQEVWSCDISERALEVARKNAVINQTEIKFVQSDFLSDRERNMLPSFDIIVSNPPYVPTQDKSAMHEHVLMYEPHLALFVKDEDPLLFYDAIAAFAHMHLSADGAIYVEIHEDRAQPVMDLFLSKGLRQAELKKDLQGKDRMIKISGKI